jgi:hypothetical protein
LALLAASPSGAASTYAHALAAAGMPEEAAALRDTSRVEAARRLVTAGRTWGALDAGFPEAWVAGTPVLWRRGPVPPGPFLAVVGSRTISSEVARFAALAGRTAAHSGFTLLSGGAQGCDAHAGAAAVQAGGRAVYLLPFGLKHAPFSPGVTLLSACPPEAAFSAAAAMERNAMIYRAATGTVVAHARYGTGGSWSGALSALTSARGEFRFLDCPDALYGPVAIRRWGLGDPVADALGKAGAYVLGGDSAAVRWIRRPHGPAPAAPRLPLAGSWAGAEPIYAGNAAA